MRIGVLGGGQLGRMLAEAAGPLGHEVVCYDPKADACAGEVAELVVGSWEDGRALRRFASGVEVVTIEFENVPASSAEVVAGCAPVRPSVEALRVGQDRLRERRALAEAGLETPAHESVEDEVTAERAVSRVGVPGLFKSRWGGYDGRGQAWVESRGEAVGAWRSLGGGGAIYEPVVGFDREVSLLAVRTGDGVVRFFPAVENEHRGGILVRSRAPAVVEGGALGALERGVSSLAESLGIVGVLAVEFFEVGGRLLANEFAPRVHNSGHWSIEGASVSQFRAHLEAVSGGGAGGSLAAEGESVMLNIIGARPDLERLAGIEGASVHWYGKSVRAGRKLGHVTVTGFDGGVVSAGAGEAARVLAEGGCSPVGAV